MINILFAEDDKEINELVSLYLKFESACYLSDKKVLKEIEEDFNDTFEKSIYVDKTNLKRNRLSFRIFAGILNLISPFM